MNIRTSSSLTPKTVTMAKGTACTLYPPPQKNKLNQGQEDALTTIYLHFIFCRKKYN